MALLERGGRLLVAAVLLGCGSSDPPATTPPPSRLCTPGTYVFCRCADNQPGTHLCHDDGQGFDACACEDGGSGGSGASEEECPGKGVSVLVGESTLVSGTTLGASDDLTALCGQSAGPEVVYEVIAPARGVLLVKVKGESPLDVVLYASRDVCGPSSLPCLDASGAGELEGFSMEVEAGEPVYVVVDSDGPGGPFAMTMALQPTVDNDVCPGAAINLGTTSSIELSGSTVHAKADLVGADACSSSADTADVVYAVTPAQSGVLSATLTPEGSFDGMLYARAASCAGGSQVACADAGGAGVGEQLAVVVQEGAPLYLVVDGKKGSVGAFGLALHLDQASSSVCGNSIVESGEQCDDGNTALEDGCNLCLVEHDPPFADCPGLALHLFDAPTQISGSTTPYDSYDAGSCGGKSGKDRFYALTPHRDGTLRVHVVNSSFPTVLYARTGTCPTGTEVACVAAVAPGPGAADLLTPVQSGKPLWLAVDGASAQAGTFTLSLQIE